MKSEYDYSIKLDNFEGPLEFLHHLVQKGEIDIYDIRLRKITDQFISEMKDPKLNLGAEFIGILASLLWLKSKMLLPKHEQVVQENDDELDPHFQVIHQLIDYCKFKEAAKALSLREEEQNAYFSRGTSGAFDVKLPLGIEHLSLEDLASLFQDVMVKAEAFNGEVYEESFRVSDKIAFLRNTLKLSGKVLFAQLFSFEKVKEELIVTFLAILELMKLGEACVVKEKESCEIFVIAKKAVEDKDEQ